MHRIAISRTALPGRHHRRVAPRCRDRADHRPRALKLSLFRAVERGRAAGRRAGASDAGAGRDLELRRLDRREGWMELSQGQLRWDVCPVGQLYRRRQRRRPGLLVRRLHHHDGVAPIVQGGALGSVAPGDRGALHPVEPNVAVGHAGDSAGRRRCGDGLQVLQRVVDVAARHPCQPGGWHRAGHRGENVGTVYTRVYRAVAGGVATSGGRSVSVLRAWWPGCG